MNKLVSCFGSGVRAILGAMVMVAALCAGSAWGDPGWRATISVGAEAVASGVTLSDFPVLVRISESRIPGFNYDDCATGGSDLSFCDADGNALDFEIDTWNPEGESLVWVKVPTLEAGTSFVMRWKDAVPEEHQPSAAWNANYAGVWHLGEASGVCANSTSYGTALDATPKGNTANSYRYTGTDAPVGSARQTATSAALGYLSVPSYYNTVRHDGVFTISGWVRFDNVSGYPRLFSRKKNYSEGPGWEMEMQSNSYTAFNARGNNQGGIADSIDSLEKAWVHVALVYDNTSLSVYSNGKLAKTGAITKAADCDYDLSFGCDSDGNEAYVRGDFDECRLMGGAASADWVKAEYDTVKSGTFLAYGDAEEITVDPALRVSTPIIKQMACNSVRLQCSVGALGVGATSAALRAVYGQTPDALDTDVAFVESVTEKGRYQGTVTRLYPNTTYYLKIVATNDLGETVESAVISFTTAATDDTTRKPGLWQTFFTKANADWKKDVSNISEDPDNKWTNYTDANRTKRRELMPIGAYVGGTPKSTATKRTSALWGDDVYWPDNGGQWVYWGYIYLDAAKTYKFRMKIDDNERITITDAGTGLTTVLLNDIANGNTLITSGAYTPSVTGWHAIEIRMSDGTGGAGGYDTGNGYLNSNNLGWSQDGGATWDVLQDTGSASLLSIDASSDVVLTEEQEAGVLTNVKLTFAALAESRDVYVVSGDEPAGLDPEAWSKKEKLATLAAGTTEYTYAVPSTWGSAGNTVMRFYLDGTTQDWSPNVFWRDYSRPSFDNLALDGRGGDTLVVKGHVPAFVGETCTLTVYTGASEAEQTHVWSGLAGSTLTQEGDVALTLYAAAGDEKAFAAGETYYVVVEAKANGKIARTAATPVTMAKTATFGTVSSAVSRRTVTFTGVLADCGMANKSEVSLWVGASNDASTFEQSGEAVVVTNTATFTFTHTFPQFETTYYWQLRANNTSAGGNETCEQRTAVASCKTLDTTTYTWCGGDEGDFADAANWQDNQGGDTLGYPQTANATVVFPADTKARVMLTKPMTVGTINLSAANVDVTFAQGGAGTNETKLTVSSTFNINGTGGRLVLDHVALYTPQVACGDAREMVLTNAANWYVNGNFWVDHAGSSLKLYGDSYLCVADVGLGGGDSVVDDSTVITRGSTYWGNNTTGGSITFRGTHPRWYQSATDRSFCSPKANANYQINFVVPVGGYATAPISGKVTPPYYFGYNGSNPGASALTANILDESPANRVDATITTPLVSWAKGICRTLLLEGHLPDEGAGTNDAFVWSEEEYPLTLSATIVGSTHQGELLVTGSPEQVPATLSPTYGTTALAAGTSVTCTAPEGIVSVSDTKRATCTGWRHYTVDPTTHQKTLVEAGATTSCTITGDGAWHELVWLWKVEYLVTVTSAGNGAASAKSAWVETGTKAYLSVTPDEGYAFGKWTGDVADERNKTPDLFFTVKNKPYTLTANFLKAVYVSPDGDDANDGSSWDKAFATIAKGLAANPNGAIVLADGDYPVTAQIAVKTGATILGANPGAKAVVRCTGPISYQGDTNKNGSIFLLSHADAVLRNITVTSDYNPLVSATNGEYARGVWIDQNGLVDSCVITNCRAHYVNMSGAGVYLYKGGIVRNTLITRNSAQASGGNDASGCGLFFENGGLAENCRIVYGNPYPKYNASTSAAVCMKDGTLRNCLVADNTQSHTTQASAQGVGIKIDGGTSPVIENCTIAGNYILTSTTVGGVFVNSTVGSPVIRNTVIWDNKNSLGVKNWIDASRRIVSSYNCTTPTLGGTGDITSTPAFVDAASGNYRLGLCDLVDAGVYLDWMDDALDLDGHERALGSAPDMGCYEFVATGLSCGFNVASAGILDEDSVTLTALVQGEDLTGLVYTWTLVDQDGAKIVRKGSNLATLTLGVPVGRYAVTLSVANDAGTTATATKPNVVEVAPSVIYVAKESTAKYPYNSRETAANNLDVAVEAAGNGTTIHVGDGFYTLGDTLYVTKGVTIVSENGPEMVSVHATPQLSGNAMVIVGHADAVLSGITVEGINEAGKRPEFWGGVSVESAGGTVTNCVVRNQITVNNNADGAGIRVKAGLVVDSTFTNNYTQCSGGSGHYGAVNMTGNGLIERCRIVGNTVDYGGTSYGGGIYLNAGVCRNSLIDSNFCVNYGGGAAVDGSGVLQNCTIVRNSCKSGKGGVWQGTGGSVVDCLVWNNDVNGIREDLTDLGFVNGGEGDFHLTSASCAIDAGTAAKPGALDLDHQPRVSGIAADAGCYEYDQSRFEVGIGYEMLTPFAPGVVRFSASVMPRTAELDSEQTWWTFDGSEPTSENWDAKGTVVERTIAPGHITVRFKTIYNGETFAIDNVNWFDYYGERVYVRKDAENPVFPYATPETATADYVAGIECVQPNATLVMGEGTWSVPKSFRLTSPCTIVGAGPGKTVLDHWTTVYYSAQAFTLAGEGVTLSGLTFERAKGSGSVTMNAGTITNCLFRNCYIHGGSSGAVKMTGGTIVDCVFTDCGTRPYNIDVNSSGAALYAEGNSLIDRCVVIGTYNKKNDNGSFKAHGDGAIYLQESKSGIPTLRNSVVANSVLDYCGGVVTYNRANIENCTIVNNASTNGVGKIGGIRCDGDAKYRATIVNTVVWNNTCMGEKSETGGNDADYTTCLVGEDPQLRGGGTHAFRPQPGSPAVDAGTKLNWMTGAKDVYGRDRCTGKQGEPDIGAAEAFTEGLMLLVR